MKKTGLLIILIILILPSILTGLEVKGVEVSLGILSYGYTGEDRETPSPLKESLGVSVPMVLQGNFEFCPELTLFYFDYVWNAGDERAVPAAIETADRISVFHFLLNPAFSYLFDVNEKINIGVTFSPSFLFRLPLIAVDNGEEYRDEISLYLYSAGRFFYPSAGGLFRWQFAENTALNIAAMAHLPLFHAWDESPEPFNDQLIITVNTGFIFRF